MILWIIATLCAFFIKGLCGFANTLVFTSILGFGVANVNISPVELLLGYPTNLILTWKNRNKLERKVYIPLALLVLGGSIPGAILLKSVDVRHLKVFFGIVVILIAVEMFFREYQRTNAKDSNLLLGIIGLMSGILCGLFGIGALLGVFTLNSLKQTVILIPFMIIGLFAGMESSKVLDESVVKKIVIVLLVISGLFLVGMNL